MLLCFYNFTLNAYFVMRKIKQVSFWEKILSYLGFSKYNSIFNDGFYFWKTNQQFTRTIFSKEIHIKIRMECYMGLGQMFSLTVSSDCSQHPYCMTVLRVKDGQTDPDQAMQDPGLTKNACPIIFVLVYLRGQQTFSAKDR